MVLIKNKNLGLNSEQVVVVPIYKTRIKPKYELFKKEILTSSLIRSASALMYFAEGRSGHQNVWWEGLPEKDNSNGMSWLDVDQDFLSTLKISLVEGEFFPADISSNGKRVYVLNEMAVKQIGWKDPLGKQFDIMGKGEVIGVVNDFNFKSLHSGLEPLAILYYPQAFDKLLIKISAEDIPGALDFLKKKWEALFPSDSFEYTFLNEDFHKLYNKETTASNIISYVSLLALLISCIGLFGLVLFTIDGRIKEIGLRKVAGSTSGKIIILLNLEFIKWILFSFIIACPVIFYFMHNWLENFAYRIELSWWIFAMAGIITLIISLLTVSWHTWKTATRNPVECLRHE
jgi:putative ABC transport system permease protein